MSVSLPEETAVKHPEDDEAFRADDVQMEAEWLDGLRTRHRKRRGFVLSRILFLGFALHGRQQSLLPVLLLSESRARWCSHGPIGVDAAVVGGLNRILVVLCCSIAPTDQFGSICVSPAHKLSCRSDRSRKVYTRVFFRQPVFPLFQAHKLLSFHVCSRLFLLAAPQRPS